VNQSDVLVNNNNDNNNTVSTTNISNNNEEEVDEELRLVREEMRMIKQKQKDDRAFRRQNLRKERIMESLRVPADDVRRHALRVIFDCFHTSDFKLLKKFMTKYAFDYMLFRFQSTSSTPDINGQIVIPNNLEIRGINEFVGFTKAIATTKPDQIYMLSDTTIRNTQRSCCLTSNFTMMGTCVYDLVLKKKKINEENNNKIRRSLSNQDVSNTNTIKLTELCGKVDSLSIFQSEEDEEITFDKGSKLEKLHPHKGTGVITIHFLNKEMKIHLIEYKVHFDEIKIDEVSSTITDNK
jgi:hypothetical protein